MTLSLINRNPEGSEVGVAADTDIFLELITTGDPIDNAATQVFINGTLAYDGGAFQVGFSGTSSVPFTDIRRIIVDPDAAFSSEEAVTIRVVSATTPATATIDESYIFTVEDITAPTVASALGLDTDKVLVTFSEEMRAVSAANSDDILNPANYTFLSQPGIDVPAVEVVAVSGVVRTGNLEVEVETDIELSPGVTYLVSVGAVEDLNGNKVAVPFNSALFVAFLPPVPAGRRFEIFKLYPKMNRREDITNTLLRFSRCLQDVLLLLLNDIDKWPDILDPDIAPEEFVDAMLCDMGNPFTFDLSLADKRRLLRVLVDIYKEKGLAVGMENAVRFLLGIDIVVEPCTVDGWELGEDELGETTILGPGIIALLYAFQIDSPVVFTTSQRDQVIKIATFMKPVNTHLKQIIEPTGAVIINHWELGFSELGEDTLLH